MDADSQPAAPANARDRTIHFRNVALLLRLCFPLAPDMSDGLAIEGVWNLRTVAPQFANRAVDDIEQTAAAQGHRDRKILRRAGQRRDAERVHRILAQRDRRRRRPHRLCPLQRLDRIVA